MNAIIRAVYEQGRLRPLDPVDLRDGQAIRLAILSERDQARAALADILVRHDSEEAAMQDETSLVMAIDAATRGIPAVSEAILQERQEGP